MVYDTKKALEEQIDAIIENYELFDAIANGTATDEQRAKFIEDYHDGDHDISDGDLEEAGWGALHEMPLSIDGSHIWFTLGGPNVGANVTGWDVDRDGVDVEDIKMVGAWGSSRVERYLSRSSVAFEKIAEMFADHLEGWARGL